MHRRNFVILSAAAALVLPVAARADPIDYTPGLVDQLLAEGRTVFVDFKASWCTTCARQERVINALLDGNPAYEEAVVFVNVDWDRYKRDPLTERLAIPRRSTLVVLRGDEELGRIVAGTSEGGIKSLMDTALAAASS